MLFTPRGSLKALKSKPTSLYICKENVFNPVCQFYTRKDWIEPNAWHKFASILWLFLPVTLVELPDSQLVKCKRKGNSVVTSTERHFLSDPVSLAPLPLLFILISLFLSHSHFPPARSLSLSLTELSLDLNVLQTFFHTWIDSEVLFFYSSQLHGHSWPFNLIWSPLLDPEQPAGLASFTATSCFKFWHFLGDHRDCNRSKETQRWQAWTNKGDGKYGEGEKVEKCGVLQVRKGQK